MDKTIKEEDTAIMKREGTPIVILHGNGRLSNFDGVASYFSEKDTK
jgi:hypothetical protein